MPSTSEDLAWIEDAARTMDGLEPREFGSRYPGVRREWAEEHVGRTATRRLPALLVALFEIASNRGDGSFRAFSYLKHALEEALPSPIQPAEAIAILEATTHVCGHTGIEFPLWLAREAFAGQPYPPAFFDALRAYKAGIKGLRSAQVTSANGIIALLLWQDPREPLRPRHCISRGVRVGFLRLDDRRKGEWTALLHYVDRSARRRPDRQWVKAASHALADMGEKVFANDLNAWLSWPDGSAPLSTGGRHVLKTLIWFAGLCDTDRFDELLPQLIDLDYAKPKAAVHLIYAVGFWLESRPAEFANPHRAHLRAKWPIAGSRIRG